MELLAELGWESVNALQRDARAGGHAGARLAARRRPRPSAAGCPARPEPATCPSSIREEALAEIVRDRSLMDRCGPTRRSTSCCGTGTGPSGSTTEVTTQFATSCGSSTLHDSTKNDWLACQQFWVKGDLHDRRPDVVLFVNGIPLVLIEFKEPHRSGRGGLRRQLCRLPRHDPAAVRPERVRHPLERVGGQGRRRPTRRGSSSATGR